MAALILRTIQGDQATLGVLFNRHAAMVHRTALRLTMSADEADDVVQDVFIGLPEALRHYREHGTFESWLRAIAVRVALMRLRAARSRENIRPSVDVPPLGAHEQQHADRMSLAAALARLSEEHRTVFMLKVVEGFGHDEIAAQLGIRRGTSEVRLYRAIR
ncbi:MAG: sigma-70 family RNA polymerase sigma factor, partial [bacterium]